MEATGLEVFLSWKYLLKKTMGLFLGGIIFYKPFSAIELN